MRKDNTFRIELSRHDAEIVLESLTHNAKLIKKIIVEISSDIKKDVEFKTLSEILTDITNIKDRIEAQKEFQTGLNTLH